MTDPLSHNIDFGYDTFGRQTTVTNHEGYVTTTAYNLLDQVTSVTTPDPDGAGAVTSSVTTYSYDRLNRTSSVTDALSGVTSYTYDVNNNLINLRDPLNNDTSWAYDNAGLVTMETNELGNTRSYWHDAAGNLTRYRDRNERVTQYTFDDLDRMTAEKWLTSGDPVPTIAISTTTQGGPSSEVQRVGFTASMAPISGTYTLSFGGQTTSAIAYNASAATVQAALEALSTIGSGNIAVTKTQNTSTAQEWTLTFQGTLAGANQNQVTINSTSIFAMGKTDIQATDTAGGSGSNNEVQVVTLSNATDGTFRLAFGGQTTAPIAYNASNSTVDSALEALTTVDTVTVTGSNGGPWTITFTGTHANVNVATLQGDAANTQSGSVARTISYTYDTASQLTNISDSDSTYAYTYDNIGRVLTTSNSGTSGVPTVVLTSVYDAASNRTQLSATVGGTNDFKNDYTYDYLNRMTQVAQIGNGGNTVANKRANFGYNALGQFTSVERQVKPSSTWNEVATTAFTYDTRNRLTGIDHKRSGTSLFTAYAYTYDQMDRITGITSQDGTVAYTYDKTSQLTGADYNYQTDETFTWDANGNPSGGSNTVGTNNRLTSDGTYNYTFDDEGNMTRRTKISDSSYTDYTWDYRNRLTSVVNKTSGGTATMSADYAYDVYDRRIKKVIDADGAGGGGSVTSRYVYEDTGYTQVVLQFDGSSNLTHRYLHGPAIDQLLADEDASNNLLWNLSDHQNTVRDLINNSGVVQNHLKYSAFGNVTAESAAAVDFLMGFAGMDRDEETSSWYSWMRHMENGRWKSQDPWGFNAGDANLSRYMGNHPTLGIDPSGLAEMSAPLLVAPGHVPTAADLRPGGVGSSTISMDGPGMVSHGPRGAWSLMRWVYTGSFTAPDDVYTAALDAAGVYYLENAGTTHQALRNNAGVDPTFTLALTDMVLTHLIEGEELNAAVMDNAHPAPQLVNIPGANVPVPARILPQQAAMAFGAQPGGNPGMPPAQNAGQAATVFFRDWWPGVIGTTIFVIGTVGSRVGAGADQIADLADEMRELNEQAPQFGEPPPFNLNPPRIQPPNRPLIPDGLVNPEWHHDAPQHLRPWFDDHGIDIERNDLGRWVEGTPPGRHQNWSHEFNTEWERFIRENPDAATQQIEDFIGAIQRDIRFQ